MLCCAVPVQLVARCGIDAGRARQRIRCAAHAVLNLGVSMGAGYGIHRQCCSYQGSTHATAQPASDTTTNQGARVALAQAAARTPALPRWQCCPRLRMSRWRSGMKTCALIHTGVPQAWPAGSAGAKVPPALRTIAHWLQFTMFGLGLLQLVPTLPCPLDSCSLQVWRRGRAACEYDRQRCAHHAPAHGASGHVPGEGMLRAVRMCGPSCSCTPHANAAHGASCKADDTAGPPLVNRLPLCVASLQDERSQHKNKAKAMKVLAARLYEAQQLEQQRQLSK